MQIAATPEATVATLARDLNMPQRSLRRHITELEKASYLRRRRAGNLNCYDLNLDADVGLPGKSLTLGQLLNRMN